MVEPTALLKKTARFYDFSKPDFLLSGAVKKNSSRRKIENMYARLDYQHSSYLKIGKRFKHLRCNT
ncbi:MAG TPA: hypothetical protein PK239_10165 [Chitinophagales bacterium]|nr:hypothetical protein [Chitinophagales bacterium]